MFGYEKVKGLLVAEVGTRVITNITGYYVLDYYVKDCKFIICRLKEPFWDAYDYVEDIFSTSKYYTSPIVDNNYCVKYFPLIDAIDNFDVIKYGYISRRVLYDLIHETNEKYYANIKSKKENNKSLQPKTESKEKIINEEKKYKELTSKKFDCEPTIGRKKEINNLITVLASDKKSPILVGESGTGKTSIVDEFAYLIQKLC